VNYDTASQQVALLNGCKPQNKEARSAIV